MDKTKTLVQAFALTVAENAHAEALLYYDESTRSFLSETYQRLYRKVLTLASFLKRCNFILKERVAILSDNNASWPVVDFAIQALGGINVAKGSDSKVEEIAYILNFCEIEKVFLENKTLVSYFLENREHYKTVKQVFVMYDEGVDFSALKANGLEAYSLSSILQQDLSKEEEKAIEESIAQGKGEDIVSIIFTSGTTGEPKGVVLSHTNILFQVNNREEYITVKVGTRVLCVLPIWHSFQRMASYCFLMGAGTLVYSKPIPHIMLRDITLTNPQYIVCVPRLLTAIQEGVYSNLKKTNWFVRALFNTFFTLTRWNVSLGRRWQNKIAEYTRHNSYFLRFLSFFPWFITLPFLLIGRLLIFRPVYKKLGKSFKSFIVGGGKLPKVTERFFSVLGLSVQDSYGLTETAPGVAMRKIKGSLLGTVGPAFTKYTQIEIRDEEGKVVPRGVKGEIYVRGPQVMAGGYYKQKELTRKVLDEKGWFRTGDLGRISYQGDIEIVGRAKDTIVLLSGKNVEPQPLEDALRESNFIENVFVTGQDQKYLGALIVISLDALEKQVKASQTSSIMNKAKAMVSSTHMEGALKVLQNRAHELLANHSHFNLTSLKDIPIEKWYQSSVVKDLIASEIRHYVSPKMGFKDYEMITSFVILPHSFEVGREISPKLEAKRHVINELYKKQIEQLFE